MKSRLLKAFAFIMSCAIMLPSINCRILWANDPSQDPSLGLGGDIVTLKSAGSAQEGRLGSKVEYDLTLERSVEAEQIFRLRVLSLSAQFAYQFNDPQRKIRVSQIKIAPDQPIRHLVLCVFIPEKIEWSMLGKPQGFYVAVLPEEEDAKYEAGRLILSTAELVQFKGGMVELELTPVGVAKFELIAQNLYFPIKADEIVETLVTLKNIGSRNLENIRLIIDLPSNKWNATIGPELVKKLDRQQEAEIQILITPPEDVEVGASAVKVRAECEVDNVKVEAYPKNLTIHVSSRADIATISLGWSYFLIMMAVLIGPAIVILLLLKYRRRRRWDG